jgi:Peptidase M15
VSPADFADALRAYCYATDASVTSYGRTPARNRAVGGVATSYHLTFQAADVVYDRAPAAAERQQIARHLGLRLVLESDHDHLEPKL